MNKVGKGMKILVGIIIAIVIIVIAGFAVYFVAFTPKVKTTSINAVNQQAVQNVTQKFSPEALANNVQTVNGKKQISLTTEDLSNVAAYAVSKSSSASKIITGVKVQPEGNNVVVYATGKLKGVSSQAKITFNVTDQNGQPTLKYDSGKVGFISIPESEVLSKIPNNQYVTVNPQSGTITVNPDAIAGHTIEGINTNDSNLNLVLGSGSDTSTNTDSSTNSTNPQS
ncbi:MAG: hypothetical protein ACRDD2_00620 [Sarcina sp.]